LRKSIVSLNFSIYFIEVTFSKSLTKQVIAKLRKSVYSKDFEMKNCIAISTQFIKSIKIITSNSRYYKLTITTNSFLSKIVNKRSKRDLAIETSSIKKTC